MILLREGTYRHRRHYLVDYAQIGTAERRDYTQRLRRNVRYRT